MQIKARKVEKKKGKKKKRRKTQEIKNGLRKKMKKIEMKDRSQENEFVTRQEMILGLITFKHMLWAYLSFLS